MEQTTRILWLSDIHYTSLLQNQTSLSERNKMFITKIEEYLCEIENLTDDQKVHYVILSGDLAFSGKKEDYDLLEKDLIQPLKKALAEKKQQPYFLCCPGNHDVDREQNELFKRFISNVEDLIENEKRFKAEEISPADYAEQLNKCSREKILDTANLADSKLVFQHYSNYAKPLFNSLAPLPINIQATRYIDNGCLYGDIIDEENKLVFHFLNSSWFSLGDQFDKLIKEHFSKGGSSDIEKILTIKDYCNEFGKQIVGQNLIRECGFAKNYATYPHYLNITVFHHPLNWLDYYQKYSYENDSKTDLTQLLEASDIFLTGHEHVNVNVTPEVLYEKTVHIPGGMFIQDKNKFNEGGQNRFSVLEIDQVNKVLSVKNYVWAKKTIGSKQYDWILYPGDEKKWNISLKNKISYFLTSLNISQYRKRFKEKFATLQFINNYIFPIERWSELEDGNSDFGMYYYITESKAYAVCVPYCSSSTIFLTNDTNKFIKVCSAFIENPLYVKLEKHICFLQLDIFAEPDISRNYCSELSPDSTYKFRTDEEIQTVYTEILKNCDFKFNKFRNHVFSQFMVSPGETVNETFLNYVEVRFSTFVVPFWEVNQYIQKK